MLPTPTADAVKDRSKRYAHGGMHLSMAAKMLPTPRAAEWKGTGPLGSKSHSHRASRGYLDATMQEMTGQTGRLNPRFVEWMMGVPPGHTDFDASAMPSSRRSPKSSAARSASTGGGECTTTPA
jgi:hypothetical protein